MATSASAFAAHEFGGGAGASALASDPAITVTSTIAPSAEGSAITVGVSWLQSIVK